VEWLRKKLIDTLSGAQPVNKKLLGSAVAAVVLVVFLISNASIPSSSVAVSPSIEPSLAAIESPKIFVHLVGEVKNPGIYELDAGARLIDAILAAQGFSDSADQGSVNLARELTDGEQIIIGLVGDAPASSGGTGAASNSGTGLISLSTADQALLETLPGVGPALAGRIIDYREANGGFRAVADLMNVSGIGDKVYARLKDLVSP